MATAIAVTDCTHFRIGRLLVNRLLREEHEISELLVARVFVRNTRYEADLVDQMQLERQASGSGAFIALAFRQGKQSGARAAPNQPG